MSLLDLPSELLTQVLSLLPPADIVHVGRTCRDAHNIVKPSDSILWHTAFLQVFDDPQDAWFPCSKKAKPLGDSQQAAYWYNQLKRRISTLKAINPAASGPLESYGITSEDAIQTMLEIIDTAKSGPTAGDMARGIYPQVDDRRSYALNMSLLSTMIEPQTRLENLIHDSHTISDENEPIAGRPVTRSITIARKSGPRSEAASRLHVLYGRTVRDRFEHGAKGAARRIVYDWKNPMPENEYGPFKKDKEGEIDWSILEAVSSVMLRHFEVGADGRMAMPQGFCYAIPDRTLCNPEIPQDWARVTGSWIGTYSFLDYADLFAFNTEGNPSLTLEDIPETHGDLMILDLHLDSSLEDDPRLKSNLPRSEDLPVLYFTGTSRSWDPYGHPRLLIRVIGCVSLCVNGRDVRWRYIISYRGQEQWQLEGIQPGGIRSGPVYGVWTQWGHEEHSPVGAFLYVPDELCKRQELALVR